MVREWQVRLPAAKKHLLIGFKLVHEEDAPFLIREHRRKFQWGCSKLTAFHKVA